MCPLWMFEAVVVAQTPDLGPVGLEVKAVVPNEVEAVGC